MSLIRPPLDRSSLLAPHECPTRNVESTVPAGGCGGSGLAPPMPAMAKVLGRNGAGAKRRRSEAHAEPSYSPGRRTALSAIAWGLVAAGCSRSAGTAPAVAKRTIKVGLLRISPHLMAPKFYEQFLPPDLAVERSEERRVGKECRSRW